MNSISTLHFFEKFRTKWHISPGYKVLHTFHSIVVQPPKMEPGIWRLGSGKMSLGDCAGANYVWDGMRPK